MFFFIDWHIDKDNWYIAQVTLECTNSTLLRFYQREGLVSVTFWSSIISANVKDWFYYHKLINLSSLALYSMFIAKVPWWQIFGLCKARRIVNGVVCCSRAFGFALDYRLNCCWVNQSAFQDILASGTLFLDFCII